jgi:hypothetical protein
MWEDKIRQNQQVINDIDPLHFEMVLLLESINFKNELKFESYQSEEEFDNQTKKYKEALLKIIYPAIKNLNFELFNEHIKNNFKFFTDNIELTRKMINHMIDVSSDTCLYLVTSLRPCDANTDIFSDEVDTKLYHHIMGLLKTETPASFALSQFNAQEIKLLINALENVDIPKINGINSDKNDYLNLSFYPNEIKKIKEALEQNGNDAAKNLSSKLVLGPSWNYSQNTSHCANYISEIILNMEKEQQDELKDDIEFVVSHFDVPALKAKFRFDTKKLQQKPTEKIAASSTSSTSSTTTPPIIPLTTPHDSTILIEEEYDDEENEDTLSEKEKDEKIETALVVPLVPKKYLFKAVIVDSCLYVKVWREVEKSNHSETYYLKATAKNSDKLEIIANENEFVPKELNTQPKKDYVYESEVALIANEDLCTALSNQQLFTKINGLELKKSPNKPNKSVPLTLPLQATNNLNDAIAKIQNAITAEIKKIHGTDLKQTSLAHSRILTANRLCNIRATDLVELKKILLFEQYAINFTPDKKHKMWGSDYSNIENIIERALNITALKNINLRTQDPTDLSIKSIIRDGALLLLNYVDKRERSFKFKIANNCNPESDIGKKIKTAGELAHQLLKCKTPQDLNKFQTDMSALIHLSLYSNSKLIDIFADINNKINELNQPRGLQL